MNQKLISLLLLFCLSLIVGCAKEEEEDDLTRSSSSSSTDKALWTYTDGGSYSYFQCLDYSNTDFDGDQVDSACDQLSSCLTTVPNCDEPISYESGSYTDSTGYCEVVSGGDTLHYRWFQLTGASPSETALCTALSGTWNAD